MIANHVKAFEEEEYDVAVAPSGSCVASVKHQHPMIARRCGDAGLEARATAVGDKTYELSELLVDVLGVTDAAQLGSYFPHRITYHPSCHGMRLLRLGDRQLDLLRSVGGIELAELPEAEQCCGFGGTFSMKNADVSSAMLADKTANISSTGAVSAPAATHPASCISAAGCPGRGSAVTTMHFAEILASTSRIPPPSPATSATPREGPRDERHIPGDAVPAGLRHRKPVRRRALPGCCPPRTRQRPAAGKPRPRHPDHPGQTADCRCQSSPTGKSCARRAGPSRNPSWPGCPSCWKQFEANFTARGGKIHWARDAVRPTDRRRPRPGEGVDEVVKVKSMATQEIGLNEYLEEQGIAAFETDLAELIVQLGPRQAQPHPGPGDPQEPYRGPGHFPARNARRGSGTDRRTGMLAVAARAHLRRKFLTAKVAVSGANFALADSGTLGVVESEGNGRMCLTLPETLITVMGVEKLLPACQDLEVFMQLLPRSSTGERMNPYTSLWTGVTDGDGPPNVHVVLLDNGRSAALADEYGPLGPALHPLQRVHQRLPGLRTHRRPRLRFHIPWSNRRHPVPAHDRHPAEENNSLPYASSLCGACYDACPVKINIPDILVHLRGKDVDSKRGKKRLPTQMDMGMKAASWALSSGKRLGAVEKRPAAGPRRRRAGQKDQEAPGHRGWLDPEP